MNQVFLDDLILYNLLMNGLLLAATAYLARLKISWLRLFCAALFGSLYLIVFFVPGLHLLTSLAARLLCPLPMVWIAFPKHLWWQRLRLVGLFYLVSMGAGGVTLGSYFLATTNPWWNRGMVLLQRVPSWMPVASVIVLFLLLHWLVEQMRTWWRRSNRELLVKITLDGQSITVKALLDTGNELKDPISGRPVMVVEQHQFSSILPVDINHQDDEMDVLHLAERLGATHWADRIRLLPFHSIGNTGGLLIAIRPDKVEIETDHGPVVIPDLLVALGQRIAPTGHAYHALLPAAVGDWLSSSPGEHSCRVPGTQKTIPPRFL